MKLCVIPARGGSKRIPGKNIKEFCGKPMIGWSIEVAKKSGCFDRIIVSTDDEDIARVAIKYGAEVPFMRPAELSDDYTGTIPVVAHAVEWLQESGQEADFVCCIYATAPFISEEDLYEGMQKIENKESDYVFSVTSYAFPIQRAIKIKDSGTVEMFFSDHYDTRSQDLEEAYHDAGQFYWGRSAAWLTGKPIFSSNSIPVILPRHRVQDIDTLEDWTRAEWMFKALQDTQVKHN